MQYDWAAKWALYSPEKIALKEYETGRTLTFAELNRKGTLLAQHLAAQYETGKGDRIAVLAENCLEYFLLFVAAQKTGFILAPINYRFTSTEIDHVLRNSSPKLLLSEEKFRQKLQDSELSGQIHFHGILEEVVDFAVKNDANPSNFQPAEILPDDPVFILYTSGTTGFPKGALYTHKMLFWNSINTAMSLIVNTESRTVNVMPPFHTGGWNVLTTPFFHHGGYSCIVKKFDPATVLKLIEEEEVTIFMGVPTMLKMMASLPGFETADFSKMLYIIVGGEPMPIPLIETWKARGVAIRQGYGMTEVGPNLTSLHQTDAIRKKGSIGRPNFYVEIKIVDENGSECAPNEPGELLLRGPMVTPGYWQNQEAAEKVMKDGWFHTGDMVRQDGEGYLYVVDRIKNMFISGGENVYPAEVERVLLTHPAVAEAAVIGVADERWGEAGKAFLVKKSEVGATELLAFCYAKLAKFKVPKSIVFLTELPKNDTGKIDRKNLKNLPAE